MKVQRRVWLGALLLEAVVIGAAVWAYPRLPDPMVTHWGLQGEPNGWMPRLWGVLLGPLMVGGIAVLFYGLIPMLEPWRENLKRFWVVYQGAGLGLLVFLAGVYMATLAWNLGYPVDIPRVTAGVMGLLFLVLAQVLQAARPNWFIGIRTPWTLSSPWVWHRTHQVAAVTMRMLAVGFLLCLLWPRLLLLMVALTLFWAGGLVVYSFVLYRRRAGEPL